MCIVASKITLAFEVPLTYCRLQTCEFQQATPFPSKTMQPCGAHLDILSGSPCSFELLSARDTAQEQLRGKLLLGQNVWVSNVVIEIDEDGQTSLVSKHGQHRHGDMMCLLTSDLTNAVVH